MRTRKFKTWRDPYDEGFSPCRPREIEIKDGFTVFVGCNGSGKTTLINSIKTALEKENIPVLTYDNLHDGGHNSIGESLFGGNMGLGAALWTASEGEAITINVGGIFSQVKNFLETGETKKSLKRKRWAEFFNDGTPPEEKTIPNERWIIFDAMDSGLSIDNILDIKGVFNLIFEDAKKENLDIYIIAVANEYELANGEECFDVTTGKYLRFADYEEYRKFIINSRKKKDKRDETAQKKREKRQET